MLKALTAFSGFSVNDLTEAKTFYTEKLGLRLDSEIMGLNLQLPTGGKLFIYHKDDHQPAGFTILNFVVDNIDAAVDELSGYGVIFERYDNTPAPQDSRGILRGLAVNQGPDIAWFRDPSGNILSLLQEK